MPSFASSTFVMDMLSSDKDANGPTMLVLETVLREWRAPRVPNIRTSQRSALLLKKPP
jgi:hypothetical protein